MSPLPCSVLWHQILLALDRERMAIFKAAASAESIPDPGRARSRGWLECWPSAPRLWVVQLVPSQGTEGSPLMTLHGEDGTGQRDKKTYTFTKSGAQMNMRSALRRGSRERAKKDRKPGQPDQREPLGTGMTSCTGALSLGRPWL